ncbi:MAG TPA: TonB C-terminal domain-containing protein [Gallionella sp.]|nr:TonB C-terminal domain-containing protein [Gallionella sp.]
MSAAVYQEPYKLPAGLLVLAVHGAFFALLYFGFSWQAQPPATMSVDLWQSIPDTSAPALPMPKEEEVAKPQAPAQEKPDIALPEKKKREEKPKPEEKPKSAAQKPGTSILDRQYAIEQAARAEQAAVAGRLVDEYAGKIAAKIRKGIVMPPDVPDEARAVFAVTVLPGGRVLPPRLVKSSGNAAWDNAVERAIYKAEPLPLPADPALFNRFREMQLGFRPKE